MPRRPLPVLTTTGRPELSALEGSVRDMGTDLHRQMGELSAEDISYTPGDASDWVSPAPTTLAEALDRLAAAGGVTPVP